MFVKLDLDRIAFHEPKVIPAGSTGPEFTTVFETVFPTEPCFVEYKDRLWRITKKWFLWVMVNFRIPEVELGVGLWVQDSILAGGSSQQINNMLRKDVKRWLYAMLISPWREDKGRRVWAVARHR